MPLKGPNERRINRTLPLSIETEVTQGTGLGTEIMNPNRSREQRNTTLFPLQENIGSGTGIGTLIPI